MKLEDLVDRDTEHALPATLELTITEDFPPRAVENLQKMKRLGILNASTLMSLVAQAPLDPINLMGTLMQLLPDGWAFSAVDFSMMRVIASEKKTVTAAMHVDLLVGNVIKFLARNKADQLVVYKDFVVTPAPDTWDRVQAMMSETIGAAEREAKG